MDNIECAAEIEFMSHISEEIQDIVNNNIQISLSQFESMRINCYERKYILKNLSPEAFIYHIEYCLKYILTYHSDYTVQSVYDDFIKTDGIRELLRRYKELLEKDKNL